MSNKKFFASFMLLLATLFWGLSYTVQSISASGLGPFTTVFFKGAGGFFLLPLLAGKKKIDRETLTGGLLMGAFAFGGCLLQLLKDIQRRVYQKQQKKVCLMELKRK